MQLRYKFGPRIDGLTLKGNRADGARVDPVVSLSIDSVDAADPGMVTVAARIKVDAYDPAVVVPLVAVHALYFTPGDGIPTDPQKCLAATVPQASLACDGQVTGIDAPLPIYKAPEGSGTLVTVLVMDDTPAGPASPPAG